MDPSYYIGKKLKERYEILSIAGVGGMGAVFKARQDDLERFVAIKILSPEGMDEDSLKRFEREAKSLSRLSHLHIASFYSYGLLEDEDTPYIVMEFIEGESLTNVLATTNGGYLSSEQTIDIALQVSEALAYAHNNGVLHRDLKPGNIILQKQPQPNFVKLVDFGLSYLGSSGEISQHLTKTGHLVGTPQYLSPEQCMGQKADARSDIYALGCIMFQMLCGAPPFASASAMELIHMHASEKAPTLSKMSTQKISAELNELVMNCLTKQAEKRYQSMTELHEDLLRIQQGSQPILQGGDESPLRPMVRVLTNKMTIVSVLSILFLLSSFFTVSSYIKNSSLESRCTRSLSGIPDEATINEWIQRAQELDKKGDKKASRILLNCIRKSISNSHLDLDRKLHLLMKIAEHFFQENDFSASTAFVFSAIDALPKVQPAKRKSSRDQILTEAAAYLKKRRARMEISADQKESADSNVRDTRRKNDLANTLLVLALGDLCLPDIDMAVAHANFAVPLIKELKRTHHLNRETLTSAQLIVSVLDGTDWREIDFRQRAPLELKMMLSAWDLVNAAEIETEGFDLLQRQADIARQYLALGTLNKTREILENTLQTAAAKSPETKYRLRLRVAAVMERLGDNKMMKLLANEPLAGYSPLSRHMQIVEAEIWAANYGVAIKELDKAMENWKSDEPDALDNKITIYRTYATAWGDQGEYTKEEEYLRKTMAELKAVPRGSTQYTVAYFQVVENLVKCLEAQKRFAEANQLQATSNLGGTEMLRQP